jgi:methyl-accepting chemotaxis protein
MASIGTGKQVRTGERRLNQHRGGVMNASLMLGRLLLGIAFLVVASSTFAQEAPPASDKAKEIVALVEKAAALVNAKGSAAFSEFKKNGSEWRHDDLYLFGNDMKGVQILNAGFPEREGTDQSKFKDADGKLLYPEFMKVVQSSTGSGWVTYRFPKPGETQPSKKWSYLKAVHVDGKPGLIGAGFYPE